MASLSQKLEQKQKLSPRQILESNIMQLNYHNLEHRIVEELEKNPMLEIEEENQSGDSDDDEDSFNIEDLESNPEEFDISYYSNKENNIENIKDGLSINLTDDIVDQLYDINYSDDDINIAKEVLGNLNERGYLEVDLNLISDRMNESLKDIEKVVSDIKLLDPPGIASNSIQDCLLAQLEVYYPDKKLCKQIIENSFDDYVNKKFNKIIKKYKCSDNDLAEASQIISVLNPTPAINYANLTNEHIAPDILIEKVDGKWNVVLNEPTFSNLRINKYYIDMLKSNKDKDANSFIKNKINSAQWFIDAIQQRFVTIRNVVESIIKHQSTYFNFEDRVLKPMILEDIANDISMDISTVSRVTNGKYVQMPWGVKELKSFFTSSIKMNDGTEVSSAILKKEIINLIDSENKKKPYTDEEIMHILNEKGYVMARRTVAKYRELLKYPTSRLRKTII
jgi:RNA polymerase sigma-54 factor